MEARALLSQLDLPDLLSGLIGGGYIITPPLDARHLDRLKIEALQLGTALS